MKIAVEGCAHGELENIYNTIALIEKEQNYKVDLLLCCGDFQATRNLDDLNCMAIPKKFHDICSFYKYYSGEKVAPILTIFIGGNHEASNYLQELPYGGWVAPNIYYLGYAGVVNVNGIRIGGVSGIYKGFDFHKGHFEFSPYNNDTKRSVYHVRQLEVFRLKQLSLPIDVMMSHDWPRGVVDYGNYKQLIKFKPYFSDDIHNNKLGSPPCEDILKLLKPTYWFSAHLHCRFTAVIPHEGTEQVTKFLALDKCLPKRRFLQILEIDAKEGDLELSYDLEWLTVLKTTNHLINAKSTSSYMPGPGCPYRWNYVPTENELVSIREKFHNNLVIPNNFCRTAEPHNANIEQYFSITPKAHLNTQTTTFCDILGIDDPLRLAMVMGGHELNHSNYTDASVNQSESDSSFNTTTDMLTPLKRPALSSFLPPPKYLGVRNPDELVLDDDSSDTESSVLNSTIDSSLNQSSLSPTNHTNSTTEDLCSILQYASKLHELSPKVNENKSIEKRLTEECDPPEKKFKRRNQAIYAASDD